jgi:Rad3-related DNA helicase
MAFPAFPYTPYDIQQDFMKALYKQLEIGGVGLFESPTGLWQDVHGISMQSRQLSNT